MKILVLGSDGQIGEPLTKHLRGLNHTVIEFDIYSNPITDLRTPNILDNLLPEIDFVFFLAFDVGGSLYLKTYQDTFEFISNNIKIMNNTFDSLKKHGTPFLFASSQMSNMSYSTYGILKHIGEKYTKCLNGMLVKFWNVYGYEKDLDKSHVITDFILMAKQHNRIDMRTTGEESRQFLYSVDCCECLTVLMDNYHNMPEKEFDISNFEWVKIIDIAKIVSVRFNNCPINPNSEFDDVQKNALREPDEAILQYWKPKTLIADGIDNIIKAMKEHE